MTPGCVKASAEIISNMDHTADPCDDFYQFACGGFIEKTVIPDDRTRMSSFSVLSDELLTQVSYCSYNCFMIIVCAIVHTKQGVPFEKLQSKRL